MLRTALISFLVTLALVVGIGLFSKNYHHVKPTLVQAPVDNPQPPPPLGIHPFTIPKPPVQILAILPASIKKVPASILENLTAAGWPYDTAKAVIELNKDWFALLQANKPATFIRQMTLLRGLGTNPMALAFIARHPEICGLLIAADSPEDIIAVLSSTPKEFTMLLNLYILHGSPSATRALTIALTDNAGLIFKLYKRGLFGSEMLFIFARNNEAAKIYQTWLQEILMAKITAPSEELASTINMILTFGVDIRRKLRNEPDFRANFSSRIWPKLARVAAENHNLFDLYLDDPRIWDLLALKNGEELLRKRGALIPIDLLFGHPEIRHNPYPPKLHAKVIQILLNANMLTIQALMKFRNEPLFHELLQKPIPTDILSAALNRLFEAGSDYPQLLAFYNGLSLDALAEEVGPAPGIMKLWTPFYYTVWEVPKKLFQGRSPTSSEWFNSIADPASFLLPLLKIGVAVINMGKTISEVDEESLGDVQKFHSIGVKAAAKQVGASMAAKLSEAELINFRITEMLTRLQQKYQKNGGMQSPYEITKPILFMLDYSGEGGQMANIYRRFHARLISFPGLGFGIDLHPPPGKENAISKFFHHTITEIATQTSPKQKDIGRRQNISAWWLLQASDTHGY